MKLLLPLTLFIVLTDALVERDYIAAVYQHTPYEIRPGRDPRYVWDRNLDVFEEQIIIAASKGADIIVFPEGGTYGNFKPYVTIRENLVAHSSECPDPDVRSWTPCEEPNRHKAYPLVRLSCMAQENSIYVVANVMTIHDCQGKHGCPQDGHYNHNTIVVFDRKGKLILRYFKTHLFFEVSRNTPAEPQIPIFETDFGRFGVCICFDSVFKFPIIGAIKKAGIRNIIFSTHWVDALHPALVWQHGFAAGNDVNFLASNAHCSVTTGGGIFSGKEALSYSHGENKLNIAKIPFEGMKAPAHTCSGCSGCTESDPAAMYRRPHRVAEDVFYSRSQIAGTNIKFTFLDSIEDKVTLCENDLCCNLVYKIRSKQDNEVFALGVKSGPSVFKQIEMDPSTKLNLQHTMFFQVCTLMKCPTRESCGKFPLVSSTTFDHFTIEGNFSSQSLYPSVVNTGMTLPGGEEWSFCPTCGRLWSESGTGRPLAAAFLLGRQYEKDELDPREP